MNFSDPDSWRILLPDGPWYVPLLAAFAAGLLRGFAGFGSAMLMAPIFALAFGSLEMVATIIAMELAVSVQLFGSARRDCRWSVVGPMSIAACLAMPLGLWLLASLDKTTLTRLVSAIVAGFALVMLLGWRWRGRQTRVASASVGAVSGAMLATTSVGGPPVLLYMLSGNDPAPTIRANAIMYYFITHAVLLVLMAATGIVGWVAFARAVVLFPLMWIGARIGGKMFFGADEKLYRMVALGILLAVGVYGLIR